MVDDRVKIHAGLGIDRRKLLKQIGAVAGAASVAGCGSKDSEDSETSGDADGNETPTKESDSETAVPDYQIIDWPEPPTEFGQPPDPEREITFVTANTNSDFFIPVIAGMHDAAHKLDWKATYTGPSEISVEGQVEILESVIDEGTDAIGTYFADNKSYDSVINRALDNDIPVFAWNQSAYSPEEMRETFGRRLPVVGQDHLSAGYASGVTLAEKLPDDATTITIARCCDGFPYAIARGNGIEAGARNNTDQDLEFTEILQYGTEAEEGVTSVENHISANPDLDAIVSVDAFAWFISNAIENLGMADDIVVGGADLVGPSMEAIAKGTMDYSFGQDPYSQGHEPVMQAYRYLDRGVPPKDMKTGAEIVDEENIEWVQRRSETWGSIRDWHRDQ